MARLSRRTRTICARLALRRRRWWGKTQHLYHPGVPRERRIQAVLGQIAGPARSFRWHPERLHPYVASKGPALRCVAQISWSRLQSFRNGSLNYAPRTLFSDERMRGRQGEKPIRNKPALQSASQKQRVPFAVYVHVHRCPRRASIEAQQPRQSPLTCYRSDSRGRVASRNLSLAYATTANCRD